MRASAKLGTWYNVVVGDLKLDSFGRDLSSTLPGHSISCIGLKEEGSV